MTARASYISPRRGARVVEWDGLENRCTGNRTVGSNPTLSATLILCQVGTGDGLEQRLRIAGITNLLKRVRIP